MKFDYSYWTPYFVLLVGTLGLLYFGLASDATENIRQKQTDQGSGIFQPPVRTFQLYKLTLKEYLQENDFLLEVFKTDLEAQMLVSDTVYIQKANVLRLKNQELLNRLNGYKWRDNTNWITFKDAFDYELARLDSAFTILDTRRMLR